MTMREFAESFVDDVAIHSDQWRDHLSHLVKYLDRIKSSGLTLNLKKCKWAQKQVKFWGKIVGSCQQLADPEKLQVVEEMSPPKRKLELRRILGFFCYFREHIQNFAAVAKVLNLSLTSLLSVTTIRFHGVRVSRKHLTNWRFYCRRPLKSHYTPLTSRNLSFCLLTQAPIRLVWHSLKMMRMGKSCQLLLLAPN